MAVDATGKVGSRSSSVEDAVRVSTSGSKNSAATNSATSTGTSDAPSILDQVDIGLSKTIQEALDPEKLSAERKAKIAKLKEQIDSGQYKPSAEVIARSVSQEIVQEIYFSGSTSTTTGTSAGSTPSILDVLGDATNKE